MAKFCTQTRDDHVQDMCWVLYIYRGRRYENNDFFQKCVQVGQHFCSGDLRSVGGTVGSRSIPAGWLAGWLQLPRADQATKSSCSGPTGRNS